MKLTNPNCFFFFSFFTKSCRFTSPKLIQPDIMCNMENKMKTPTLKMFDVSPHSWNHFFISSVFWPLFSFVQRNISYNFHYSDLYIPNKIIFFFLWKFAWHLNLVPQSYDFLFFSHSKNKHNVSDSICGAVSCRVASSPNHFRHFSDHTFHAYSLLMCFIDLLIFNVCDRSFSFTFAVKRKTKTCSIQINALQLQSYFHYRIQTIPNNMKLAVHSVRHNRNFSKKNNSHTIDNMWRYFPPQITKSTVIVKSHLQPPFLLLSHENLCYFVWLWQPEACDIREYLFYIVCLWVKLCQIAFVLYVWV